MKKTILKIFLVLNIIFSNQSLLSICNIKCADTIILVSGILLLSYHSILIMHLKHCLRNIKINKDRLSKNSISMIEATEGMINYSLKQTYKYLVAGLIISGIGIYRSCKKI